MPVKFITAAEAAKRNGLSVRRIQQLCSAGKINGAQQFAGSWAVPERWKWTPQKPGPKPKK
jgi:hypothetical protein